MCIPTIIFLSMLLFIYLKIYIFIEKLPYDRLGFKCWIVNQTYQTCPRGLYILVGISRGEITNMIISHGKKRKSIIKVEQKTVIMLGKRKIRQGT